MAVLVSIPDELATKVAEALNIHDQKQAIREALRRFIYGGGSEKMYSPSTDIIKVIDEKLEKICDIISKEISDIKSKLYEIENKVTGIQQRKHSSYHQYPQASSYNKKEFFLKMDTNIEGVTFALGYSPKLKTVCIYAVTDKKTYNLGKLVVKYTDMGTRIGFDINKFEKVIEEMCHELGYEKSDVNGELDRYMEYLEGCKEEVYNVLAKYGLSEDNIKIVEEY